MSISPVYTSQLLFALSLHFRKPSILKPQGYQKYLFVFIFSVSAIQAQKLEVGASTGLMQYKGDLQPNYKLFSGRPAASGFVRYNVIPAISIKGQGLFGFVAGNDKRIGAPQHRLRGYEFSAQIMEYGGQIEYNFLDFRTTRNLRKADGSPYLFVGYNSYSLINRRSNLLDVTIPAGTTTPIFNYTSQTSNAFSSNALIYGIGYKKIWKSNWNIGGEFGARKLSNDIFDNFGYIISNTGARVPSRSIPSNNSLLSKFNVPNTHLQDMYFYLNFSVSYVFYKVHCPNPR